MRSEAYLIGAANSSLFLVIQTRLRFLRLFAANYFLYFIFLRLLRFFAANYFLSFIFLRFLRFFAAN